MASEINQRAEFERALIEDRSVARLGTLALCPIILSIFKTIARFFSSVSDISYNVRKEGDKKGGGGRGKGGQMNDATLEAI